MKLTNLLELPVFKGATLAAGERGVEREVNTVNMMDAPDIIHFLKRNDLLVTTAFHFKDDHRALLALIKEMERQGCAALGIKTKRFLQEIPEEAITLANNIHFPVIELPVDTSLGDIVNQSLSYILDVRTNELHHAMQTHQQFTSHAMRGQGINQIITSLSTLIEYPVLLLNHQLRPAEGQALPMFEKLEDLLINGFSFHLPKVSMSSFSVIDESRKTVTLFPVYTHKKQANYLAVLGHITPTDSSTILTVEQAANVIAFELMKKNALKQHDRRIQNEFFTKLVNGVFSSDEEVISRGKEFGLYNDQKYICAVGQVGDEEKLGSSMNNHAEKELIYETIEFEIQSFGQTVHLFTHDESYILLLELKGAWKNNEQAFTALLTSIQAKIHIHIKENFSFGISNYAEQIHQVPIAYKEAKDALYYGNMLGKKQFIEVYQPKEVPEILRMIPYDQLEKFYTDTFQGFANDTKKDHQVLLQTLSVYLETHCQLSETAKRLYVHRNTVIYRLEKCEEIIGRSLKEPEETLRLRIAFRIRALLG